MSPTYKCPSDLTNQEFDAIHALILLGDEVNPVTLRTRLLAASLIGFISDSDNIVSVAVMKNPSTQYKTSTFFKATAENNPVDFEFELGYVFTHKSYRKKGYASILCRELCEAYRQKSVYATTRVDNFHMQRMLASNYFLLDGKQYKSDRNDNVLLNLYVKQPFKKRFHVSISKSNWENTIRWESNVHNIPLPSSTKTTISIDECISFETKEVAIKDLLHRIRNVDFGDSLVLLLPSYERITSLKFLEERLQTLG